MVNYIYQEAKYLPATAQWKPLLLESFFNQRREIVDIENVSFFFFYMILPSPNQPNIVTNLVFFYYPRTYPQTNKVIQNSIQTIAIHFFLMDNLTCIWKAKY